MIATEQEVVENLSEATQLSKPPLLVIDELAHYLDSAAIGHGAIKWQRIGEGQSNVTYRITRGERDVVLRRGPRPPYPPSAHNMVREAKLLQALESAGVRVPEVVAICEDDRVLGVPFYLMEYIEGIVITDELPAWAPDRSSHFSIAHAAIDELVKIHSIDVSSGPLMHFGKQEKYLERQLTLFNTLWLKNTRREIEVFDEIAAWLENHCPQSQKVSVVHGDYRIGNLMFQHQSPAKLVAVLDWEMATLGDPLADLGYFSAMYASNDRPKNVMELTSVTRQTTFPSRQDLIERYASLTGLDMTHLDWYEVLAYWKSAVFCEAIYTRWLDGERPNDGFGPRLKHGVPKLLEAARAIIHQISV